MCAVEIESFAVWVSKKGRQSYHSLAMFIFPITIAVVIIMSVVGSFVPVGGKFVDVCMVMAGVILFSAFMNNALAIF